jgi:hypothetical protein
MSSEAQKSKSHGREEKARISKQDITVWVRLCKQEEVIGSFVFSSV